MVTLKHKLYESLLDDEDELIKDNSWVSDDIKDFMESDEFKKGVELNSCYIDDQISHGGFMKLCSCHTGWGDIPRKLTSKDDFILSVPSDCVKKEPKFGNYYNGSVYIKDNISHWNPVLKIAPVSSTTVQSKVPINPLSLPEFSVLFTSNLSVLSDCEVNCRIMMLTFDKEPSKNVKINIMGNLKKMNCITFRGEISDWNQISKVESNTSVIHLMDTPLGKDIIKQYVKILKTESNPYKFEATSDFNKFIKNFKNLNRIVLDVSWEISKDRRGNWEVFCSKIN